MCAVKPTRLDFDQISVNVEKRPFHSLKELIHRNCVQHCTPQCKHPMALEVFRTAQKIGSVA